MLAKPKHKPCRCRRCGRSEPDVRFGRLGRTLCLPCWTEQRAGRLAKAFPGADPAPRERVGVAPLHLAWVRSLGCAVGGHGCGPAVHAHHVRDGTGGGTGMKPADWWTVPLCARHHAELHAGGAHSFEARWKLDLRSMALHLASRSPHLPPPAGTDPDA